MEGVLEFVEQPKEFFRILGGWKVAECNTEIEIAIGVLATSGIRTEKVEPANLVAPANGFNPFLYLLQIHRDKLVGASALGYSNL